MLKQVLRCYVEKDFNTEKHEDELRCRRHSTQKLSNKYKGDCLFI